MSALGAVRRVPASSRRPAVSTKPRRHVCSAWRPSAVHHAPARRGFVPRAIPPVSKSMVASRGGFASWYPGGATEGRMKRFLAEAGADTVTELSEEEVDLGRKTKLWRWLTFVMIWIGYCVYYLTRGSFTFVAPLMQKDLGITIQEIGRITTVFPLMYGCSKFASGVLADTIGARAIFGMGLVASSLLNISFAQYSNITTLTMMWAANGFFQGFGGPACARILTTWYPANERGTWWALWSSAHNVGGLIIPLLAGGVAQYAGWRFGMIVPGVVGLVTGAFMMVALRDSPTDVGLAAIEAPAPAQKEKKAGGPEEQKMSAWEIVTKFVLTSKAIWALAVSYFFVYVVRQGLLSWSLFYLSSVKDITSPVKAAAIVAMLELGGLGGSIASGTLSDWFGGHRIRVSIAFMAGTAASIMLLPLCPAGNIPLLTAAVTVMGFFIYGPQMLIGLIGAEISHPLATASANGLLGWIAYLGAAFAGEPLAILVKQHGWAPFFTALACCCAVPAILMLPLWNVRTYEDLQATGG